jgi:hypothetical protein
VPYTDTVITSAATTEPSDPTPMCGNGSPGKSVWYVFTAPSRGTVTADTFDSNYDTILSVYTGSCGGLSPVADGCSDDDPFDGAQSKVSLPSSPGTTYYFMVSAFEDDGGSLMFRLRFFLNPATATPTRIGPSATPTPTASPTPGLLGDANCDGRVSAADIPALLQLIASGDRASCQLDDANGDGSLDSADIVSTVGAIFKP